MNSNTTILVVDDQGAHRDLCRSALSDAGFAVVLQAMDRDLQ